MGRGFLTIFSGLPGVGKSTIAQHLVLQTNAVYIRIDTIEQELRDKGMTDDEIGPLGYAMAHRIAAEELYKGNDVVADMVNPWKLTRDAWHRLAKDDGHKYLDVEVICSDIEEHRRRVESRTSDIPGLVPPSWQEVITRHYHPWDTKPLRIDSAKMSPGEAVARIRRHQARAESRWPASPT